MKSKWAAKKKTINFSEKTLEALKFIVEKNGGTETQAINTAVQELAASLGWER